MKIYWISASGTDIHRLPDCLALFRKTIHQYSFYVLLIYTVKYAWQCMATKKQSKQILPMQIHLLCIISIHSRIIPVIYVVSRLSCLVSSLLDFFCFSCFFISNLGSVFLPFSLSFLPFWTFSASRASLCPIQALFSCFPLFASFSFGLFLLLLLLYVQFNL